MVFTRIKEYIHWENLKRFTISLGKYIVYVSLILIISRSFIEFANAQNLKDKQSSIVKIESIMEEGSNKCSATVVSHKALLTATHCLKNNMLIVNGVPHEIKELMHTGTDVSIVIFEDNTFNPEQAVKLVRGLPEMAEEVSIIGMPGVFDYFYRKGYVMGYAEKQGTHYIMLDLNAFFGDSGSGVFNRKGEVIGVISAIGGFNTPDGMLEFKYTVAPPLDFTDLQLEHAGVKYD